MEPAIKKLVIVLVLALIVVLGLIALSADKGDAQQTVTTIATTTPSQENNETAANTEQTEQTGETTADIKPNEGAKASEADATNEAQSDQKTDAAQEEVIYEGAVAGLSEEEIAKMALAEEQSAARTEETGIETAVD